MSILVLSRHPRHSSSSFKVLLKLLLFCCWTTVTNVNAGNGVSTEPIVIVISFDGFRYDYFKRVAAKNINYLAKHGVTVPFMMNQFVTKTFTNHQSIVTGLYPESHGVTDNTVFDPLYQRVLGVNDGKEFWNFNEDVFPLWTLNELAGGSKRSGSMMWPSSNNPYGKNNSLPSKVVSWNDTVPWEWRVDTVISWLTDPEGPVNLVFMYFEEPDEFAHGYGPESPEVTKMIMQADDITGYLIRKLREHQIFDEVNLILLSDHGFHEVKQQNIINISSVVDTSSYDKYGGSPNMQIKPKDEAKTTEIYQKFKEESERNKHFSVYTKDNLPSYWNYKNNRRVMPIVLVPDVGHAFDNFYEDIQHYNTKFNLTANASRVYGMHGYDNREPSMHAFFVAHGPLFQHGVEAKSFSNVDVFPLICVMLGIPIPPNNGSLSHIEILHLKKSFSLQSPVGWVFGAAVILGLTILFGILSMMIVKHRNRASTTLIENGHGYRFVNKDELMKILDDEDEEVEISGYRSENNTSVHNGIAELNLKQTSETFEADEIQLLLSSSHEEL